MKLSETTESTIFIEPEEDELVTLAYVRDALARGKDMAGLVAVVRDDAYAKWAASTMRTHGHSTDWVNTVPVEIDFLPPI